MIVRAVLILACWAAIVGTACYFLIQATNPVTP